MKASLLICMLSISVSLSAQWKLVWSDEFNYSGLPDSSKWSYETGGHGWGNHELQYYTTGREKNARVENRHLVIEAYREPIEGMQYSSARLVTRGKGEWQYGKIAVRARIPQRARHLACHLDAEHYDALAMAG